MIPTVAFPSVPDTETPSVPKVILVSPFWIDLIFCNASASWISSLEILLAVSSEATTLIFPFAPVKPVAVVPCPAIFTVVLNGACALPLFPVKSSPACANACKSPTFTALFNPSVLVNKLLTAVLALSAVIAVGVVPLVFVNPNPLAKLFNVVPVVVSPFEFTTLNSGLSTAVGVVPPVVITLPLSST